MVRAKLQPNVAATAVPRESRKTRKPSLAARALTSLRPMTRGFYVFTKAIALSVEPEVTLG
jgi:hypothetical protein